MFQGLYLSGLQANCYERRLQISYIVRSPPESKGKQGEETNQVGALSGPAPGTLLLKHLSYHFQCFFFGEGLQQETFVPGTPTAVNTDS